jgi:hypothetical protein
MIDPYFGNGRGASKYSFSRNEYLETDQFLDDFSKSRRRIVSLSLFTKPREI